MKKIPTLYMRDEENRRYVTDEVTPGCEWVLDGEGIATRKFDGVCVKLDDQGRWWARREVKPGKKAPDNYQLEHFDEVTGKSQGWEPIEQSSFAQFLHKAVTGFEDPGTYELCGPKINGNPESYITYRLVRHGGFHLSEVGLEPKELVSLVGSFGMEGIVWHHPDGRMAKLKARDLKED